MIFEDFYSLLGLPRGSSAAEVRKAYRRLVLQCHPDRHPGDAVAEEKFKKLSEAYGTLSNPEKRRDYDARLLLFEEALAEKSLEAARQRRESVEVRRRDKKMQERMEAAEPWKQPSAFGAEANQIETRDFVLGVAAGGVLSGWLGSWLSPQPTDAVVSVLAWSIAPICGALVGGKLGAQLADVFDEGLPEWLKPFMVPGVALAGCAVAILPAPECEVVIFPAGFIAAACAAGIGSAIGGGVVRAFTSVAARKASKAFGAAVGGVIALAAGGLLGMLFANTALVRGTDNAFFEGLLNGGAGGALGGMLAAIIGSLRRPVS